MKLALPAIAATFAFFAANAPAEIELGAPFADNAVLHREMPLPVWGWGKILQTDPTTPKHKAAWDTFYLELETAGGISGKHAHPDQSPG